MARIYGMRIFPIAYMTRVVDVFDGDNRQVFPDWFANNTEEVWTEALTNWSLGGVEYSGLWLDMNEVSAFCLGSW